VWSVTEAHAPALDERAKDYAQLDFNDEYESIKKDEEKAK
jgi:hypothetical protein